MTNSQKIPEKKITLKENNVDAAKKPRVAQVKTQNLATTPNVSAPSGDPSVSQKTTAPKGRKSSASSARTKQVAKPATKMPVTKPISAPLQSEPQDTQKTLFAFTDFGLSASKANGDAVLKHIEALTAAETAQDIVHQNTKFWTSLTSTSFDQAKMLTEITLDAAVSASRHAVRMND